MVLVVRLRLALRNRNSLLVFANIIASVPDNITGPK